MIINYDKRIRDEIAIIKRYKTRQSNCKSQLSKDIIGEYIQWGYDEIKRLEHKKEFVGGSK